MIKHLRLLILLVVGALLLVACPAQPGAAPAAPEPAQEEPAVEEPAEAPAEETVTGGETLQVIGVWTEASQESFEAVLDAFTEQTGIAVNYTPAPGDLATVIGTRLEGGAPPDVAMLPQPGLLIDFAQRGALVPLEDIAGDLVDENYGEIWRTLGTVDDTLYGVWFKGANKSLLWYNADLLTEAGVEPPQTWEEFLQAAETISAYGVPPISVGGGSAWTLTDWFENVYLRSAGPEMYDQLTVHEIEWTDASVQEAFEYLAQIWQPDYLAGGVEGALSATHPEGIVRPFLDPPQAAMVYGADFSAGAIMNETDAELGTTAQFVPFPAIEDSPLSVVGGGDVAVLFNDSEAGRALIRFLASPESAEVWAPRGGYTSPNLAVDPSVYPSDVVRQSAEMLRNAEVFRFDMSDLQPPEFGSTGGQGLFGLMGDFLRTLDVDQITEQLEAQADQAFGE